MNDARVISRLAGIAIVGLLTAAGLAWVIWACWIDRSWAHEHGNPIWYAWMAPLFAANSALVIGLVLKKYFEMLVKPMWKGV